MGWHSLGTKLYKAPVESLVLIPRYAVACCAFWAGVVIGYPCEGWMFLVMLLALLLAITLVPEIVLWLPQRMGYVTH